MAQPIAQPAKVFTPRKGEPITPTAPKDKPVTEAATLNRAVKSMEGLYALVTMGLTVLGLDKSLEAWENAQEGLEESNRESLAATPKLAAQLARVGETTGGLAFVTGNALAIMPVVKIARAELAARRVAVSDHDESASRGIFTASGLD